MIEKENLAERAEALGGRLHDRLAPLVGTGDVVDVRNLGLILAIELSSFDAATAVVHRVEEAGILVRQPGEVIMAVPPLTIVDDDVDRLANGLESALSAGAS